MNIQRGSGLSGSGGLGFASVKSPNSSSAESPGRLGARHISDITGAPVFLEFVTQRVRKYRGFHDVSAGLDRLQKRLWGNLRAVLMAILRESCATGRGPCRHHHSPWPVYGA